MPCARLRIVPKAFTDDFYSHTIEHGNQLQDAL
jgi:hypothetical protein